MTHPKVKRAHLTRKAAIYLRQSTMKQVHEHRESTRRQYALRHRAIELGWPEHTVDVVDDDLGQSGASTRERPGFQRMAHDVSMGNVGAVFALEVSRFARSSADWHKLLDLCGLADVLIADEHDVFAPNDPNDRLLLGLKGQMSEAERYWMRLRLRGAQESKARRGELKLVAPTGYIWDDSSKKLEFDPDEEIHRVIKLVFQRFQLDCSGGAVVAHFIEHGLMFPTRQRNGEVTHRPLVASRLRDILHNPIYAGAYVFGRRQCRTMLLDGEVRRGRSIPLPLDSWKVNIPDQHAAFITWEEFLMNQKTLENNRNGHRPSVSRGAARDGPTLLQGVVLCGRCGYRMTPQQGGALSPRYICTGPVNKGISARACWSVASTCIDSAVERQFLQAAQPPELELSLAVTRQAEQQGAELEKVWRSRLERARYEAQIAERRYKAVDPDNRVVSRSLESDWETKLLALAELDQAHDAAKKQRKVEVSPEDRKEILSLSRSLPRVWRAPTTSNSQRKNMLRILIQEVALTPLDLPQRMTKIRILWHTGTVTEAVIDRPRRRAPSTSEEAISRIRDLWQDGRFDQEIAERLQHDDVKSCKAFPWTAQMVRSLRRRHGMRPAHGPGRYSGSSPDRRPDGLLSLRGVARQLGVSTGTVRRWTRLGHLAPAEGGGRGRTAWYSLDSALQKRLTASIRRRRQ